MQHQKWNSGYWAATSLVITVLMSIACGGGEGNNDPSDNQMTGNNQTTNNQTTPANNQTTNNQTTPTNNQTTVNNQTTPTNQTTPPNNQTTPPNNMTSPPNNQTTPMGSAALAFKPTYGSNFGNQIPASWRPGVAASRRTEDAPVVVMLCATSDATCEDPITVVETYEEGRDPVQGSFGPDVVVDGLPAGEYNVMIFLDAPNSRERGLDWESTPARTTETAWGGHVSEFDVMMSDPEVSPGMHMNPPPKPVTVTLEEGKTVDLGTLRMAHFHERRMDPVPQPENGVIAVVTENGLRMINLTTFEVEDAGGGFRDFFLADAQGNDLGNVGSICGMIQGPDALIYVLFRGGTGAGFAVPFDARTRTQVGGGNIIEFPGGAGGATPCSGIYHEHGGKKFLYVLNASASGLDKGDKGLWSAEVSDLANGNITGIEYARENDDLFEVGFNAIAAHEGTLYATMSPENSDSAFVPADTVGQHTIFKATIDAADPEVPGALDFQAGGDYDYWTPLPSRDGIVRPDGNIDCVTSDGSGGSFAGLYKADFHDGKPLLFLGGCNNIAVFDLAADTQLDAQPSNPRSKAIDGSQFGQAFTRFALSPDGTTLYALPQFKSQFHFYFAKGGDDNFRQTFNRYMIFPLALDQGTAPGLHPDFAGENVDGHEGITNIGDKITPAADPGIDINVGHLTRYQVDWAPDLAGSTNQSGSIPTGPSIAVGNNTIWLRGSGVPGVSGLGKGSNLMAYSVSERRAHLWAHNQNNEGWDFYHVWTGGNEGDAPFGYDLTPENNQYLATYGLLYVGL